MTEQRILTTHTGSLPRPPDLAERMLEYSNGTDKDPPGLWDLVASATREVVQRQVDLGIDIVSDGEYGKASYAGYVKERLTGFDGEPRGPATMTLERDEFPDWVRTAPPRVTYPTNNGPVRAGSKVGVQRDIANLQAALVGLSPAGVFMTAASPGVVDTFMPSTYYPDDTAYLRDLGQAMRDEYRAIVEAGFVLQVDCPDLAMSRHTRFASLSNQEFRAKAQMHIDVLNEALAGLPPERVRLHMCWGNYEGPHNHDLPLADVIDIAMQAPVGAISIEAANPRHAHEWQLFRSVSLPRGMKLIPGVIDSCTNYIEHPDLVAERITRFAEVVGPDNVIASTDCGFGTSVGPRHVAPSIAWAKLGSLVEGARIASSALLQTA
jgi:5-methyltetrahydropteroyltriglutamate--homocysteine methyltransferase